MHNIVIILVVVKKGFFRITFNIFGNSNDDFIIDLETNRGFLRIFQSVTASGNLNNIAIQVVSKNSACIQFILAEFVLLLRNLFIINSQSELILVFRSVEIAERTAFTVRDRPANSQ